MKLACIQVQAHDWNNAEEAWHSLKETIVTAAATHDLLVVPEAVYPAYFLAPHKAVETTPVTVILDEIRSICRQTNTYIAFGYADGEANTASLFNRNGDEIARKEKSYLWHFDHRWFKSGPEVVAADTEFGRIALVVCADARLTELVRAVALDGAQLIVDLANLTASGPHSDQLTNAQCAYMLETRARENHVWLAVSDKWGVESDTITYAGRSAVYRPDGSCAGQAPANENAVLSVDIPTDATGKIICQSAEALPQRRPELYALLSKDTQELPIYRLLAESVIPELTTPYVTVSSRHGGDDSTEQIITHIRHLLEHEPDLMVLPTSRHTIEDVTPYQNLLLAEQMLVLSDVCDGIVRSRFITNRDIRGTYLSTHPATQFTSGETDSLSEFPCVVKSLFGQIGIVHESEALLPEVMRCLMLGGADLIIWQHGMPFARALPLTRTRAAENRIFVASIYASSLAEDRGAEDGCSFIVDPGGNVIASTLLGHPLHATGSFCALSNARVKAIVPGTHVVFDRKPKNYRRLTSNEHSKV